VSEIFAAVRWWAALMGLGLAALPFTWTLFRSLPDRGYAFTKLVGLLLVSYLFWILGSLGLWGNQVGGILAALLGVIAFAFWFYRRGRLAAGDGGLTLTAWLRENWRQALLTELLFAALFGLWVWVRAQNPAITATEKPMEFAFLNAAARSPGFPPLDPWLSGFGISYYYFGYVMTALIARLALVPTPLAFNLGIAWLAAGAGTAAFGLVYNLVAHLRRPDAPPPRRLAVTLGLIAALALPIAGNQQITLELLHANGVGSAVFWERLNVRDINTPPNPEAAPRYTGSGWWWWRASRPIHEHHLSGRAEPGLEPIAEFPGFSFVLGDMHPHVLALPFAFLSLALAAVWSLESGGLRLAPADFSPRRLRAALTNPRSRLPLLLFSMLLLGGLSFLNTWDVLIHLFVMLGAFVLAQWGAQGWRWDGRLLQQVVILAGLLVAGAALLYLPFYLGFRSQAGAPYLLPMLMRPTRLPHFLIIFAMPLWPIGALLVTLGARQRLRHWRLGLGAAAGVVGGLLLLLLLFGWIVASGAESAGRVAGLAGELGLVLPPRPESLVAPGWGAQAVAAILPALLRARLAYPGVTLLLAALIGLAVMAWRRFFTPQPSPASPPRPLAPSPLPFTLLLVVTGALLTLAPEFVYLRDNFGFRLNTIFKFYYQAWVMFGAAALAAIGYLWQTREEAGGKLATAVAGSGYLLMFALALLFPYLAVNSRAVEYRGPHTAESRQPATLDGLAYLRRFNPDEYAAINWLRENVSGAPVILEAVGGQYSGYARIAANTGLPTVLGWPGHQYQWRGDTAEPAVREPAVREIYTQRDLRSVAGLLDRYAVAYIYVGNLERETYGLQGLDKFEQLDAAFQNGSVAIYIWTPGVSRD
jgi:YYY domain-containing protein